MSENQRAREALQWITTILQKHHIPFQITGGLAGIVFGSGRPLNDIDIDVPEDRMAELVADVKEYIEFGPERYKGEQWDLMILTLNYKGQSIDLSGAYETYLCNPTTKEWQHIFCDLSTSETHVILGVEVPVVTPKDFIAYKKILNRTIDGIAIDAMDADAAENFLKRHETLA